MGVFTLQYLRQALGEQLFAKFTIAVETGTFLGDGTDIMAKTFRQVYTIELDNQLHANAKQKFASLPHVTCLHGDSKEVLPTLLKSIHDQPCLFFLDAHWSGDASVDWQHSKWKGYGRTTAFVGSQPTPENQVPLQHEITAIAQLHNAECVIYIDDIDKFDSAGCGLKNEAFIGEDWSHLNLNHLRSILQHRILLWDRSPYQLIIHLRPL